MKLARRLASHDSTRACLLILGVFAWFGCLNVYQYLRSAP